MIKKLSHLLLLTLLPLQAQGPGSTIKSTWDGIIQIYYNTEKRENTFTTITPKNNMDATRKHPIPFEKYILSVYNGHIYCMKINKNKTLPIYRSDSTGSWELYSYFDSSYGYPIHFQPLSENRIVAVTSRKPYVDDQTVSPMGLYRSDEDGIFKFEKPIPFKSPDGKDIFKKIATNAPPNKPKKHRPL